MWQEDAHREVRLETVRRCQIEVVSDRSEILTHLLISAMEVRMTLFAAQLLGLYFQGLKLYK